MHSNHSQKFACWWRGARSGEGALAVDIVLRSVATSIDAILHQSGTDRCDVCHNAKDATITSP